MARVLFVVAVAMLATAVLAEYIYTDDQIDEIDGRMRKCVRIVPSRGSFNRPGDTCFFEGVYAMAMGGVKEDLTDPVVACLNRLKVNPSIVSRVHDCLVESLAKDLVST